MFANPFNQKWEIIILLHRNIGYFPLCQSHALKNHTDAAAAVVVEIHF